MASIVTGKKEGGGKVSQWSNKKSGINCRYCSGSRRTKWSRACTKSQTKHEQQHRGERDKEQERLVDSDTH